MRRAPQQAKRTAIGQSGSGFALAVCLALLAPSNLTDAQEAKPSSDHVFIFHGTEAPRPQTAVDRLRAAGVQVLALPTRDEEWREFIRVYLHGRFLPAAFIPGDDERLAQRVLTELTERQSFLDSKTEPIDRKAAFRASSGRVVLHYGLNILRIDSAVGKLREAGIAAVSAPGAEEGRVELLVNGGFGPADCCGQKQVDDGTLVETALQLWSVRLARHTRELVSYLDEARAGIERAEQMRRQLLAIDRAIAANEAEILAQWESDPSSYQRFLGLNKGKLPPTLELKLKEYEEASGVTIDRAQKDLVMRTLRDLDAGVSPGGS